MNKWSRFKFTPNLPLGANGERVTGSKAHIELSKEAAKEGMVLLLSLIHISEPTRQAEISYAVFCLKKKKKKKKRRKKKTKKHNKKKKKNTTTK